LRRLRAKIELGGDLTMPSKRDRRVNFLIKKIAKLDQGANTPGKDAAILEKLRRELAGAPLWDWWKSGGRGPIARKK